MKRGLIGAALTAVFLTVFALPSFAQTFTGRIDVAVVDSTGAVLPGVTVDLSGMQAVSATTDATGQAHFLNLAPGKYTVSAKLTGFTNYKNDNLMVATGATIPLKVSMSVGGVTASVSVKAETPLIEPKKEVVSTNVTLDELQKVPSSRDPWVVLQTVPGIIVDRVNVGGAESGQQSNFQAKGASGTDNTWNIDGISVTDMSALGSSSTYYDFDMFQEMNVTTGGSDPSISTPGAAMNMVLRSGTNTWRGSGRYYFENHSTQSNNVPAADLGTIASYNRIQSLKDYGGEGGGALIKDKLFIQGSAGETHPLLNIFTRCNGSPTPTGCSQLVATQYGISAHDETVLQDYSGKATYEANKNTRLSFTYFRGNKAKQGRGASAFHPAETTFDQTGPTSMYKGEGNFTLGNSTFVSARYAHVTGGFSLTPEGGVNTPVWQDANAVWHGSFAFYNTVRPQDTIQADGNVFKGKNELKFGFAWKKASVTSDSGYANTGGISNSELSFAGGTICPDGTTNCAASAMIPSLNAQLAREHHTSTSTIYSSAYLGDTISAGRATFNLGVRWDRQAASLAAVTDPANTLDPLGLLPALSGTAASNPIVWNSFVPRAGMSLALDKDHKTLVHASYAMFASQINATQASVLSGVQYTYTYYVNVPDLNGNHIADKNELAIAGAKTGLAAFSGILGSSATSPNKIGSYSTPRTQEALLGFDHQVMANLAIGGTFTYRRYDNFDWNHLQGIDGSSYSSAGTYTCTAAQAAIVGTTCSVGYFAVPSASLPSNGGKVYETRPNYHQDYVGFEVNALKRMSHNWMSRVSFSSGKTTESIRGVAAELDPTPMASGTGNLRDLGPNISGGDVSTVTTGSGKSNIFLVAPKYQVIANFAYQMKYGINIGASYLMRQGYAEPYFTSAALTLPSGSASLGSKAGANGLLLVNPLSYPHLPTVNSLDGRIGKTIKLKSHAELNLDLDAFNLLNLNTTLGRQYDLNLSTANQVIEIMNPRIVRFGVRISF